MTPNNPKNADNFNILIVDDIHDILLEKLSYADISYAYRPEITRQEASLLIPRFDGLIIRSKFQVDQEFIDLAPKLQLIARSGAGTDNIDEPYAKANKIDLISANEGNCDAVGEHMIGMLLGLMNNLNRADREVRSGLWNREQNRGHELKGKTVGLIGYGHNGRAMAKKLSGFDVRVIAYDKYQWGFTDQFAQEVSMEEIVRHSDVLSLHIPLTRETRNLIDREYLSHFRKPIFLLSGARGEIVDIPSVLEALDQQKIIGAAFDVLPVEKFPALSTQDWYKELIQSNRIALSPHVAGWTFESYFKLADILADKILKYLAHKNDNHPL
ncbi:MAG: NAD(P)-dependent oxidoreductase [Sphingobacterium sp.]